MSSLKDRLAASRKAIADQKASYDRAYKFKTGKTTILILPGVQDPDEFSKEYGAHYIRDPSTDSIIAVVGDASICYGKPCPVRDAISQYIDKCNARGDDDGSKKAKGWLAKSTNVLNVLIVAGPDTENKGKVVRPEISQNGIDAIMSIMEDFIGVDPDFEEKFRKNGFMLNVERVGTGKEDTKYTYSAFPKQPETPLKQEWLDARVDLQSIVDGKFGTSVHNALTKLSVLLGKDVTQTALGAAIQQTAKLAAPAPSPETPADDDLTALLGEGPIDAEFTDAAGPAEEPVVEAASGDQYDSILADLDAL